MNGFLVVVSHTMDDFACSLHATRDEAFQTAMNLDDVPTIVRNLFASDASTPVCVSIVEFQNGLPIDTEVVKDLSQ